MGEGGGAGRRGAAVRGPGAVDAAGGGYGIKLQRPPGKSRNPETRSVRLSACQDFSGGYPADPPEGIER